MTRGTPASTAGGRKRWRLAVAVGTMLIVPAVGAHAQRIDYTATLAASRGAFIFSEPTTSWVFDQGFSWNADRWRLGVNLPVVRQNSSAITYIGGIPIPTGGPYAGAVRGRTSGTSVPMQGRRGSGTGGGGGGAGAALAAASFGASAVTLDPGPIAGLVDSGAVEEPGPYETQVGDPVLQAGADFGLDAAGRTRLGFSLLGKVPVATVESGVGTGEFDYGAGLSFSVSSERGFLFADVTHWRLGDLPDLPLNDLTSGAIGVGVSFGAARRLSALASVSASTAVVDNVEAPRSAGLSLGYAVREGRFVTLGGTAGLSESAADWTVTVGWRASLRPR